MTRIKAIKTFFEKKDQFAPEGGKKCGMAELRHLTDKDKTELGELCAKELGVKITA